jgi:hypothetical protein
MVQVASDLLSQLILPLGVSKQDGIFLLGRTTWECPASCLWVPTPLTEGPAPMAMAGVQASVVWLTEQLSAPELMSLDDLLSCIRLTTTLTKLAREMAQEAAGVHVQHVLHMSRSTALQHAQWHSKRSHAFCC